MLPLNIALGARVALAQDSDETSSPDATATSATPEADTADSSADEATTQDAPTADAPVPHKTTKNQTPAQLPPPASRWKTVGLGLGFAGVWYAGAWGLREWFWSQSPGAQDLRYPIVGPWMDLYKTGCPSNDKNCGTFGLVARTVLVVIDGVGQVGGLAVALDGLFTPTAPHAAMQARRVRNPAVPQLSPIPVPWSTTGGGGLSFVGQF